MKARKTGVIVVGHLACLFFWKRKVGVSPLFRAGGPDDTFLGLFFFLEGFKELLSFCLSFAFFFLKKMLTCRMQKGCN